MQQSLIDRIAQAIGDPGSILPRRFDDDGDPAETITRWGTRAVLAVLTADLGIGDINPKAITGPWQTAILDGFGTSQPDITTVRTLHGDDTGVDIAVIRTSTASDYTAARAIIGDVAAEQIECWLDEPDDESINADTRWDQARAMAAGLNLAAALLAVIEPTRPSRAVETVHAKVLEATS